MSKFDIAILMGSKSDLEVMKGVFQALEQFEVSYDVRVLSAHRAPSLVIKYVEDSIKQGVSAFICGAGGAAHLAGIVAGHSHLPVIGIPVASGALNGNDSLLATVQMPKGIPVATVAINGAYNAGLLAVQMLSLKKPELQDKMIAYKQEMQEKVKAISDELQIELGRE